MIQVRPVDPFLENSMSKMEELGGHLLVLYLENEANKQKIQDETEG